MAMSLKCPDIGTTLSSYSVTETMLLSYLASSDEEYDLSHLPDLHVSNGLVLELYRFMNKHPQCSFYTLRTWISVFLGDGWPTEQVPTVKAICQSVIRLSEKLARLKKHPNWQVREGQASRFLDELYCLPKVYGARETTTRHLSSSFHTSSDVLSTCSSSHSVYTGSSCCSCASENDDLVTTNKELCEELSDLRLKCTSLSNCDKQVVKSRNRMYNRHRNDKKKIERRNKQIQVYKKEAKEKQKALFQAEVQLTAKERSICELKRNIDRISHRASYWKLKCENIKQASEQELVDTVANTQEIQSKLTGEIDELEEEKENLQEIVQELMTINKENIVAFEGGKYVDNIRACCFELLSLNVGVQNVKLVINTVLKNIAQKTVDRLPSKTTLCNMMLECLTLAQAQLGEELTKESADFYTLQTDGTTKFGDHFGTYDISTEESTFHLGIRQVFSGSAQTTLDTLLEIVDDLDIVCGALGSAKVSGKILTKIKNTMSDRHTAEKLFSKMLSDYRADILPDVVSNWEALSEDEKEQLTRMNNFFCGLHFVVGIAEAAEATLKV